AIQESLSSPRGVMPSSATTSGTISIREVISASRLSARLAAARRFAAEGSAPKNAPIGGHPSHGSLNVGRLAYGTWREIRLESERRQLVGQVDLIRVEPNVTTIIDFKTGSAMLDSGKLVEAYVNQLHYYFLMAREKAYGPNVRLSV